MLKYAFGLILAIFLLTTEALAAQPTGVSAAGGDRQITLNWDPVPGAISYNIYWNTTGGVTISDNKITDATSPQIHTGLSNGITYHYVVTTVDANGESAPSVEVSAFPFRLISDLTFADINLATCVTAFSYNLIYVHELTTLACNAFNINNLTGIDALTNLTSLALNRNTITNISLIASLKDLAYLDLSHNSITSGIADLVVLTNATTINLTGNNLIPCSDLEILKNALGSNVIILPVICAPDVLVPISEIPFADANLAACVNNLGLTYAHEVTYLDCVSKNISSLSGIENLINLTGLFLGSNNIGDVTPLASLNNLSSLNLSGNLISNLNVLSTSVNLIHLNLCNTGISDLTPLATLTNLSTLQICNNNISNITPLSSLTNLYDLNLSDNSVVDISPLSSITNLWGLRIGGNDISDFSPLTSLSNLNVLSVANSNITDVSFFATLTWPTDLDLSGNNISDVSPLDSLTNLYWLDLSSNNITTGVATLTSLSSPVYINLLGNNDIPCADLDILISAYDSGLIIPPDSCKQPSNTGSISGTVSYNGIQTGTIYVAVFQYPPACSPPNQGQPYNDVEIQSPGSYILSGLPDGTYYVASVIMSCGANCELLPTDPWGIYNGCENITPVVISEGNAVSGIDIILVDGTAETPNPFYTKYGARAFSGHSSNNYWVELVVNDTVHEATSVSVTGPGISTSLDLVYNAAEGSWSSWNTSGGNPSFGSVPPAPSLEYVFTITDSAGTTTRTDIVEGFVEVFATNLSPSGGQAVVGNPLFSWIGVAGNYRYGVSVNGGGIDWNIYHLTTTSVVYGGPPLTPGTTYSWDVEVRDVFGNFSITWGSFLNQGGSVTPVVDGFPIATTTGSEIGFGVAFDGTNYLVGIQGDETNDATITAQLVSQSGSLVGPRISTGRTGAFPLVAFDGTNYLLVWTDDANSPSDDIYGQFISPVGSLVGSPFPISQAEGYQSLNSLSGVAFDGVNYIVVWEDFRNDTNGDRQCDPVDEGTCEDIYGQLVTPAGYLLGLEIPIHIAAELQRTPSVAFDGTNYLVAWENRGSGTESFNVYGRFISKSGALVGSSFAISETPSPSYNPPSIAFDGTNYLVVWNYDTGPGYPSDQVIWDIYGRIVTPTGNFLGPEFAVTTRSGDQPLPFTAFDGDNFIVTWTDARNDFNEDWVCDPGEGTCADIYGQLISPSGNLIGPEFAITKAEGNQVISSLVFDGTKYFIYWSYVDTIFGGTFGDVYGTFLPIATDSDNDGMPDAWEIAHGLDPNDPSDAAQDPDQDGLKNLTEFQQGSDPHNSDTDGDGFSDAIEIAAGSDPLNGASTPEVIDGIDNDGDGWIDEAMGYIYTRIDYPGASGTYSYRINDAGHVAGMYQDDSGTQHGFIFDGSAFDTIDYPGSSGTSIRGVNDSNQVVGIYTDSGGMQHGFLYDGVTFSTIDYPGASSTTAAGINESGEIVGMYVDSSGINHGFLYDGINFSMFDYPGAFTTHGSGFNDSGHIVGRYKDAGGSEHGYLYHDGSFSAINFPGASNTSAYEINEAGEIIGNYTDSGGIQHGFLLDGVVFSTIDHPEASPTISVLGINNIGQISGWYIDASGIAHGFVATPMGTEICDGIDNDLDGSIDEGVQNAYYQDADGDTYGNALVTTQACTKPVGYVMDNTDCDDNNVSINPGVLEVCNSLDDNCNGQIDEGFPYTTVLSNIASSPRDFTAAITWNTSEPATAQVEYGETSVYGMSSPPDTTMTGAHIVIIDGLTPNTMYHYRVKSTDNCREVVSGDMTFITTDILYPNLHVTQIDMPATVRALEQVNFRWLVRNDGPGSAQGNWIDRVFLSGDEILDSQDTLLVEFNFSDGMVWETERWRSTTIEMPTMPAGTYYIIVQTDANNGIIESNENDNSLTKRIDYLKVKQLGAAPDQISVQLVPGEVISGSIDLINFGDASLTGITAEVQGSSANINIQATPPSSIAGKTVQKVSYSVTANDDSVANSSPVLVFTSAEGETAAVTFNITVNPGHPNLISNPGYLEQTMVRGTQTFVEFEIMNNGSAAVSNLKIILPSTNWLSLVTPDNISSLGRGEKIKVSLALKPRIDLQLGPYTGNLSLSADNAEANLNFRFTAVSDKFGGLKIVAKDEFTYFAADHPPVSGAAVKISNPYDGTVIAGGITDADGQFVTNDLFEGLYRIEVSAEKHGTFNAIVQINPGQIREITAFLPRQLVTYSWKVVPVQTEDRYIVTLEAVFETHVPAPVITVEPTILDLSKLQYDAEGRAIVNYTVTNHGLISANGATIRFGSHPDYEMTAISENIGEVPAMTSMVIPVEVSKMTSASGTSSADCGIPVVVDYYYVCENNQWRRVNVYAVTGTCPQSATPSISAGYGGFGGGSGGSGDTGPGEGVVVGSAGISGPLLQQDMPCELAICEEGKSCDDGDNNECTSGICESKQCVPHNESACTACSTSGNVCDGLGACVPTFSSASSVCSNAGITYISHPNSTKTCDTEYPGQNLCGVTAEYDVVGVTSSCGPIIGPVTVSESVVSDGGCFLLGLWGSNPVTTGGPCQFPGPNCTDTYSVCTPRGALDLTIAMPLGSCTETFTQTFTITPGGCTITQRIQFKLRRDGLSDCTGSVQIVP